MIVVFIIKPRIEGPQRHVEKPGPIGECAEAEFVPQKTVKNGILDALKGYPGLVPAVYDPEEILKKMDTVSHQDLRVPIEALRDEKRDLTGNDLKKFLSVFGRMLWNASQVVIVENMLYDLGTIGAWLENIPEGNSVHVVLDDSHAPAFGTKGSDEYMKLIGQFTNKPFPHYSPSHLPPLLKAIRARLEKEGEVELTTCA